MTSACSSCRFNLKSSRLGKDAPRMPDLFMVAPGTHPHTACFRLSHHQAFGRAVPLRRRSTCSSPEAEASPVLQEALSKPPAVTRLLCLLLWFMHILLPCCHHMMFQLLTYLSVSFTKWRVAWVLRLSFFFHQGQSFFVPSGSSTE